MERCQQCGSEVERAAPFCSHCGSPLRQSSAGSSGADASTMEAVVAADAPTSPSLRKPSSSQLASHPSRDEGRFAPGTLIAERYRIISMLGRGGMGEVFRADDLTLGQPVALKFLPESMIDRSMLERFPRGQYPALPPLSPSSTRQCCSVCGCWPSRISSSPALVHICPLL